MNCELFGLDGFFCLDFASGFADVCSVSLALATLNNGILIGFGMAVGGVGSIYINSGGWRVILIVGNEGSDPYLKSSFVSPL